MKSFKLQGDEVRCVGCNNVNVGVDVLAFIMDNLVDESLEMLDDDLETIPQAGV